MHVSGQWLIGEITGRPVKTDPQSLGSLITYLKRYLIQAMAGLASDDDDGNAASRPPPPMSSHDETFDPLNEEHRITLKKALIDRGVPVARHKDILRAMAGKRESELAALLKKIEGVE